MTKYYVMIWLPMLRKWNTSNENLTIDEAQVIKGRAEINGHYAKIGKHKQKTQMEL